MNNKLSMHFMALGTVVLWGSAFPFTKVIGDEITAYPLAAMRCIIAAVILVIIGKAAGIRKPFSKNDLGWFFLSGMFGFSLFFIFMNMGIATLTSATSSIVSSSSPIMTAILVCIIYKERINLIGWLSIAGAFAGVLILILWNGVISINTGIIWMFLSACVFAGYNVLGRLFTAKGYTGLEVVCYSAIFGGIQMLAFVPSCITQIAAASAGANIAMIYLGVMPTGLAYYFWNKAIGMARRTNDVANYTFLTPFVASVIGFVLLAEVPDISTLIGGAVIIISVILFGTKGNPDRLPDKLPDQQ